MTKKPAASRRTKASPSTLAESPRPGGEAARLVPYNRAIDLLRANIPDVTLQELAAWVWLSPHDGGLAAFDSAGARAFFSQGEEGARDFHGPLAAMWFEVGALLAFRPRERFITGAQLVERWAVYPNIDARAHIRAKVLEGQPLVACHPTQPETQWDHPGDARLPSEDEALFALSHVEEIERSQLGTRPEAEGDGPALHISPTSKMGRPKPRAGRGPGHLDDFIGQAVQRAGTQKPIKVWASLIEIAKEFEWPFKGCNADGHILYLPLETNSSGDGDEATTEPNVLKFEAFKKRLSGHLQRERQK
jgi:hypothetical protein